MRSRCQTTGSNGLSSARAWTRRGRRASDVQEGRALPALDPHLLQLARLDEVADRLGGVGFWDIR